MGNRVRARIVKNKVAPPFRMAEFDIMFNQGISKEGDLIDLGTEMGTLTKNGAFFSFGDVRLGQGRENAKAFLRENKDVAQHIERLVRGLDEISLVPDEAEELEEQDEKGRVGTPVVATAVEAS